MNPRKPTGPQQGPRPQGPQGRKPQHWYPYHYCPPYYYDWYDYDYDYDWSDYDYDWNYLAPNKAKEDRSKAMPTPNQPTTVWTDYQQGFKDGWKAAMDYMGYTIEPIPVPGPPPMPTPVPTPKPAAPLAEGAEE